jgi:hypothetical protein
MNRYFEWIIKSYGNYSQLTVDDLTFVKTMLTINRPILTDYEEHPAQDVGATWDWPPYQSIETKAYLKLTIIR